MAKLVVVFLEQEEWRLHPGKCKYLCVIRIPSHSKTKFNSEPNACELSVTVVCEGRAMGDLGCRRMLWPTKGGVIFAHSGWRVNCLSHENIVLIKKA